MFPRLLFPFVLFAVASTAGSGGTCASGALCNRRSATNGSCCFRAGGFAAACRPAACWPCWRWPFRRTAHRLRLHPSLFVFFWWGVTLLVFWMCALAAADGVSTHLHAARIRREQCVARAQLEAESSGSKLRRKTRPDMARRTRHSAGGDKPEKPEGLPRGAQECTDRGKPSEHSGRE